MSKTVNRAKARLAYDGQPPPEVMALAELADLHGQRKAAEMCGISTAACNALIGNTDTPINREKAHAAVKARLLTGGVSCPVVAATIGREQCLSNQAKARAGVLSNTHRVEFYRTCPACPKSSLGETDA